MKPQLSILGRAYFLGPYSCGRIPTPHSWKSTLSTAPFLGVESLLPILGEHAPFLVVEALLLILGEHTFCGPIPGDRILAPHSGEAYFLGATLCTLLTTLYFPQHTRSLSVCKEDENYYLLFPPLL